MPRQLTFDLPVREARERGDFFVSACNEAALAAVESWPDWPGRKLLLTGPPGAGKSHLAQVWARLAEAEVLRADALAGTDPARLAGRNVALEDAERLAGNAEAEAAAFHLHNLVLAEGGTLLVTAATPPGRWGLALPDLASRMEGTPLVAIGAPDEALLAAVLVKLFTDRQLAAPPKLIDWLVPRIERSFAAAGNAVDRLDKAAMDQGRNLSVPFARDVLGDQ